MSNAVFAAGDRVSWSHDNTVFASQTVLRGAHGAPPPGYNVVPLGTIVAAANEAGSWFEVRLDNGATRVLTADELVKVEV